MRFARGGIGSSDPPNGDVDDLHAWADDAIAVLDAEECDRAAVTGEGWASHVAVALAVDYPSRVDRLVLINGFARLVRDDAYRNGLAVDQAAVVAEQVRSMWGTGTVIGGVAPELSRGYMDLCGRYERLAASPAVAATMTRAMWASDIRNLLARVTCPTLVLYTGEYTHIGADHTRFLAEHIAGADLLEAASATYYDLGTDASRRYVEFFTGASEDVWAERQLAVVVFSDIVESTTQLARRGDREWTILLENCNDVVGREVGRFGGNVVKQTGDGHLLTFASPGAAISAVFGVRRAMQALGVSLRFGMHMGEIEPRADGDIAGIAVHTAARIADRASADEILVSRVMADLLAGTGLVFVDRGSQELKGLSAPVHLFAVRGS